MSGSCLPLCARICEAICKKSSRLVGAQAALPLLSNVHLNSNKLHYSNWTRAVSDAEKVVSYPTSFLSLRCLLSDEISNIAVYLKKLIGTGHPLLATAKKLVYGDEKMIQTRGLLVLLVSKAANKGTQQEILPSQRSLAEITEMIHIAHIIHNGVVNVQIGDSELEFGNKLAILCGDFLLAQACSGLAKLRNVKVVELISEAISDISASQFLRIEKDNENVTNKWKKQAKLRYGTLLANACQSSLILGNNLLLHDEAKHFGYNMALAWQVNVELNLFRDSPTKCEVDSLPSLLLASNPNIDVITILTRICNDHVAEALNVLNKFPTNQAVEALYNIAVALKS